MLDTRPHLDRLGFPPLTRRGASTLQVNLGYRCNLSCNHCHVNAGPKRTEQLGDAQVEQLLALIATGRFTTLDLTGGAPELHPRFGELVRAARAAGLRVIDRCNLAILDEPDQTGLAAFLAEQGVEVVASLPCYLAENVDAQRGKGVHSRSIAGLRTLNALGYGSGQGRVLNLVYNPGGAFLPPPQAQLEADYRQRLGEGYGIRFDHLLTLTNMPIARFGSQLLSHGEFERYMQTLQEGFQPANLDAVMCRDLVSVDWQGRLFDCDFNQMLDLPMRGEGGEPLTLNDLAERPLAGRTIAVRDHCYGCTAGQGSSCGGALV